MNQTEQKSGKVATEPGAAAGESEEAKVEAAEPAAERPANSDVRLEADADGATSSSFTSTSWNGDDFPSVSRLPNTLSA